MTFACPFGGQVAETVVDQPVRCRDPEADWIADQQRVTHPPVAGTWRHSIACNVLDDETDDTRCNCKDDDG